jgi:mitochondrial fission protein ELM1
MRAWIFVDAFKKGTEKQCIGLAQALGAKDLDLYPVSFPKLLHPLPPRLLVYKALPPKGPPSQVIISGGRLGAAMGAACKKHFKAIPCFHVLNPYGLASIFDRVIVPEHDGMKGGNMVTMVGAMHPLSQNLLSEAKKTWHPQWSHLPRPFHGVVVGGPNKSHTFGPDQVKDLLEKLNTLKDGSFLVTLSRRTPQEFIHLFQYFLKDKPHVFFNPLTDQLNPYEGMLALCDDFVVTSDSVSMMIEVAFTGAPIFLYELPTGSKKFQRLYKSLRDRGILSSWHERGRTYIPLDEKTRIAQDLFRYF